MDRKTNLNNSEDFIESEEYGPILELDYRFFEYMQEGVIVSEPIYKDSKVVDLVVKYANLIAYKQRKKSMDGFIDKSIKEVYDLQTVNIDLQKANEAISTGRGIKYEIYRPNLDKYFSITAFSPREDIYVVFSTDITDRKRAEERVENERQKLLNIIEFLPDATFVIDEKKEVIAWNKAIEEMTGIKKDQIIGKDDYAYSIPFYGHKRPIIVDLIFLEKNEIEDKYSYVKREGNALFAEVYVDNLFGGRGAYVFVKASPLYDNHGNLVGAIETVRDITEQKKAEMDLLESENKFRSTIEQSTDGISIMDEEGLIIEWNKGMKKITGHKREEELNKLIWESQYELIPEEEKTPEIYDYIKGTILQFLQTGDADWINKPLARRIQRPDGEIRFTESVTYPIKTERGTIIGSITRDITEQKKIEEALRKSEQWFKSVVDTSPSLLTILNEEGKVLYVSPNAEELTGYTPEEIKENMWLVHPDEKSRLQELFENAFVTGEGPKNLEFESVKKNGEVWWVSFTSKPIKDENGEFKGFVVQLFDITKSKKTEMLLRESEEKYSKAFYSNSAGMAITNIDGKIIEVNNAYANITGYKREELLGKTVLDLNIISVEERDSVLERLDAGSPIYNEEREIRTKTGKKETVLYTVDFIEYGGEKRVFSIIYDITKIKEA